MTYTIRYKKVNGIFWKTLKKVKGDGIIEVGNAVRWFILEDETRIEIPNHNHIFIFSKERWMSIKKNMENEIGQPILTK